MNVQPYTKQRWQTIMKKNIDKRDFSSRDLVLWLNSRLRLFLGKLNSKWPGPYLITQLFPHGAVELENKEGVRLKVNGQRIKIHLGHAETTNEVIEAYHLDEV